MELKDINLSIPPYDKAMSPLETEALVRYLDEQVFSLAAAINRIVEFYSPRITFGFYSATAPGNSNATPQPLTNWNYRLLRRGVERYGLTEDQAAGLIQLNGNASDSYIIAADAQLIATGLSCPNNTNFAIYLNDGTTARLMDTKLIANPNQQSNLTMSGSVLAQVPGDSVLSLEIASDNAATFTLAGGFLSCQYQGAV